MMTCAGYIMWSRRDINTHDLSQQLPATVWKTIPDGVPLLMPTEPWELEVRVGAKA